MQTVVAIRQIGMRGEQDSRFSGRAGCDVDQALSRRHDAMPLADEIEIPGGVDGAPASVRFAPGIAP